MPTVSEYVFAGAERLSHGPHPDRALQDAELLMRHVLGKDQAWILAYWHDDIEPEVTIPYHAVIERRRIGEPVQYIIGETEFYGLCFHVTRDVLIPRPETEHSVEKVLELAETFEKPRIVDVGTGSGAIAVSLAHHLFDARITATDLSNAALDVALQNAALNAVADRIRFVGGDLLTPIADERFEIVVSNPPYVAESDRTLLNVEVRDFEPSMALFSGAEGLAIYRRLIPQAFDALVLGGYLVLEIGYGQAEAIKMLLAEAGFLDVAFTQDLQGIPRVVAALRP
jgi:release factor glutamine methyltransferase